VLGVVMPDVSNNDDAGVILEIGAVISVTEVRTGVVEAIFREE
jgi:hypothetical protein